MIKEKKHLIPYIIQFIVYFLLFWLIAGLIAGSSKTGLLIITIIYAFTFLFAFSPVVEIRWRIVNGIRPLRLKSEKDRLIQLFNDVYAEVRKANPKINSDIKLYISEDIEVNACAFGRHTIVLNRGSIELTSDEGIKGLIAHEFGHISNLNTHLDLFSNVSNLFMAIFAPNYFRLLKKGDNIIAALILSVVFFVPVTIKLISDVILLSVNRKQEYEADSFAVRIGYGHELADILNQIYHVSFGKAPSVRELLNSTHPPITMRIERVEDVIY